MPLSIRSAGRVRSLLAVPVAVAFVAAATALTAGAAPAAASSAAQGVDRRVLVKLAQPSSDSPAIAAEASRLAGVPARYAAPVSGVWHALSLHCPDVESCDAAIARLRQSGAYAAVQWDARKQRAVT